MIAIALARLTGSYFGRGSEISSKIACVLISSNAVSGPHAKQTDDALRKTSVSGLEPNLVNFMGWGNFLEIVSSTASAAF